MKLSLKKPTIALYGSLPQVCPCTFHKDTGTPTVHEWINSHSFIKRSQILHYIEQTKTDHFSHS